MMSLTIWQVVSIAVYLLAYIVPVFVADPGKTLSRTPYALRTTGLLLLMLVVYAMARVFGGIAIMAAIPMAVAIVVFFVLWSVHRTQDIGWPRWLCLMFVVPVVGFIYWIVLLFKPGFIRPGELELKALFNK